MGNQSLLLYISNEDRLDCDLLALARPPVERQSCPITAHSKQLAAQLSFVSKVPSSCSVPESVSSSEALSAYVWDHGVGTVVGGQNTWSETISIGGGGRGRPLLRGEINDSKQWNDILQKDNNAIEQEETVVGIAH
jgi:hypothetical protein